MNPARSNPFVETVRCSTCGASMWIGERKSASSVSAPIFQMYCTEGDALLALSRTLPSIIVGLLTRNDAIAKEFKYDIRSYNSALCFTSINADLDRRYANEKHGAYAFRIHLTSMVIFKYFSASTKLLSFIWCEKGYPSNKQLMLCLSESQRKLLDGIGFSCKDKAESVMMECSGDSGRFGMDHAKGSFGALTFLRKIIKTYFYATEDMLHKLKVVFVHPRGKRIHLWSLEMPTKDVQVLEHLAYTELPTDVSQIDKILSLGNFFWKLNNCLQDSSKVISRMKEEHTDYLAMRQINPNHPSRINLATLVEKEIQKPVKGSDYGIILPRQLDDFNLDNNVVPASQQTNDL